MQIIYGDKTERSQPRGAEFPKNFSVTQNDKHCASEVEIIKFKKQIKKSRSNCYQKGIRFTIKATQFAHFGFF